MSWRFRKVFKLFPGFKLNLTPRGVSATVGASPLSVNVGPRGVYRNLSIPGTGIWSRKRLDVPSKPSREPSEHYNEVTTARIELDRVLGEVLGERIELFRKAKRAGEEYSQAHVELVRMNAELWKLDGKDGEVTVPAKKFMEYQLVVSALFAAARQNEQCNGMFVPDSLREKFHSWLVQLETIWTDLMARAINREEVGSAFGAFVAVSGPEGGGQIALDFMNAVGDYFEEFNASLE